MSARSKPLAITMALAITPSRLGVVTIRSGRGCRAGLDHHIPR